MGKSKLIQCHRLVTSNLIFIYSTILELIFELQVYAKHNGDICFHKTSKCTSNKNVFKIVNKEWVKYGNQRAKTQYDNSCKHASIAHPIVLSSNRSTGCIRPVDLGMVSGYRLQTNMRPVDAISRPIDTAIVFPPKPIAGLATG